MVENAFLNNFEAQLESVKAKVLRLPVSFWRNLIIALSLVWVTQNLAKLVWVIFAAPSLPTPPVVAVPLTNEVVNVSGYTVDLDALQANELFGKAVAGEVVAEPVDAGPVVSDNAEITNLNLNLVGVMVSSIDANSSAIIAEGSKQEIYQINDKLPVGNNVKLAKVMSDRVILNNNGNFEALLLYTEADYMKISRAQPAAREKTSAPSPKVQKKIKPSQLPKSISDVVRFSVHREEGEMVGFRIRPGKNRELFTELGLETNDIVTSVNGIAIDNAQAIRDNYQQLKSATAADLEIKRGEETVLINVSLDTSE